ncbi:MAG: tyrosine-type recombinase/integrase [Candidatus Firestonebacteria bacterium]
MNKDAGAKMPNLDIRNGWFYCDFIDSSGRRIREALKTKNLKLAQQRLMKMQTEAYEKGYFEIKRTIKILFSELATKVLEYAKDRKRCYKKVYVPMMKPMIEFFGQKYISEITSTMIEQYQKMKKEEISISYANRAMRVLKRAFNLAIQWGLTKTNPVKGIEFYKQPRGRIRYLSLEEINCLLSWCSGYLREIVLTALHTGMRKGEILGLKWGNVDLSNKLIILDKTKNDEIREIPMSNAVYQMFFAKYIEKGKNDDEYVFAKANGQPYRDVGKVFNKALKSADVKDFVFHDLRHTCASQLVMAGVDILTVKELMGHKDVKTTLIYSHLAPKHKRQAMEKFETHLGEISCHKNDTNGKSAELEKISA